jgi:hypothetical protein
MALGAVDAQVCTRDGEPRGPAHISMTFEPSGMVSNVEVDDATFAGTKVAACLEAEYGKVRVPRFQGRRCG